MNVAMWRTDPALVQWLADARLDGFSRSGTDVGSTPIQQAAMKLIAEHAAPSVANLQRLLG